MFRLTFNRKLELPQSFHVRRQPAPLRPAWPVVHGGPPPPLENRMNIAESVCYGPSASKQAQVAAMCTRLSTESYLLTSHCYQPLP